MADAVTDQSERRAPRAAEPTLWVPSAGDLLEASFADADEVGTFAGRDEPSELSYDYVEGDRRAVDVLRHVVQSEGGELDPEIEYSGPVPSGQTNGSRDAENRMPAPSWRSRIAGSLARRVKN